MNSPATVAAADASEASLIEGRAVGTPAWPERLSGLDASFVYTDNARVHMHTLKLLRLDPATMVGGYSYDGLVEAIADAATRLPNWCSRLVFGLPGVDHPRWVPDVEFDVYKHIRRVVVSGDPDELDDEISRTLSEPLPRNRPLWHATVIEGLLDGHVAVALKIHHSLADGMAFARVLESITSRVPDPMVPGPRTRKHTVRIAKRDLMRDAARTWLGHLAHLPALLFHTAWSALRRLRLRLVEHRHLTELFRGPHLPFNTRVSPKRKFAHCGIALADAKEIKKAFDVTVNDVVLAAAAEGLRHWLRHRGLTPDRPLIGGVPVSAEADRGDEHRRFGNKVSHIPIPLHTHIEDPVERLWAIHESARHAKADLEVSGKDLLAQWSELNQPFALRAVWGLMPRLPRPPINLVLASVPGPRQRLHFAGAEVADLTSVGPILDGIGLNITAWSYSDRLNFGLLACPELVPDLEVMAEGISEGIETLLARARAPDTAPSPTAPKTRPRPASGQGSGPAWPVPTGATG